MLIAVGLLLAGLVLLVLGGEGAVRGGSALASRFNVRPYVIGATVVAFGTSAPELAVTVTAALKGEPGLALGNVVGSNIANLGLILGLAALVTPIAMAKQQIRQELPVVITVLGMLLVFAWDRHIARWEGVVLMIAMTAVIVLTLRRHRNDKSTDSTENSSAAPPATSLPMSLLIVLGGLVGLYLGGQLLVDGAVRIAEWWGVPQWVIGVVIVAAGTSMPEVAASVVAAVRGHGEIALGNVLGSNTFNVLLVLGVGSTIRPIGVDVDITMDLIIVSLFTLLPGLTLLLQSRVPRWTGGLLLLGYVAYVVLKIAVR